MNPEFYIEIIMRDHRGKDKAYRPLTNLGNRMDRICLNCGNEKEE